MPIGSRIAGNGVRARAASMRQTNNKYMCGPQSNGIGYSSAYKKDTKKRAEKYKLDENLYYLNGSSDTIFKVIRNGSDRHYIPISVGATGALWNTENYQLAIKNQEYELWLEVVDFRFNGKIVKHQILGIPIDITPYNLYIADRNYLIDNIDAIISILTNSNGIPFSKSSMLKSLHSSCEEKVLFIWN